MENLPEESKKPRLLVYLIIVAVFFDTFIQIPVISPYAVSLGATLLVAGVIVAAYSISNMAGNFLAGPIIDNHGRKTPIILGTLAAALFVFAYTMAKDTTSLTLLRICHGLAIAFVTPAAFTFLGDATEPGERGKAMAQSGFAISLPALLGPPLGGLIKVRLGYDFVFYMDAFLLLLISLSTFLFLKEDVPISKTAGDTRLMALLKDRRLQIVFLSSFALMFAKGVLMYMLPLHVEGMGHSSIETGMLFGSFALSAIILFLLPVNSLSDRYGRMLPLILGLIIIAFSVTAINFFSSIAMLAIIMITYGLGFGLLFPAQTALLVDATNTESRGAAFGIFYGLFSAGVVFGPISTGFLTKYNISPFIVAGLVVLTFVAIISYLVKKYLSN